MKSFKDLLFDRMVETRSVETIAAYLLREQPEGRVVIDLQKYAENFFGWAVEFKIDTQFSTLTAWLVKPEPTQPPVIMGKEEEC